MNSRSWFPSGPISFFASPEAKCDYLDLLAENESVPGEYDQLKAAVCILRLFLHLASIDGNVNDAQVRLILSFFLAHGGGTDFMSFLGSALTNSGRYSDVDRASRELWALTSGEQRLLILAALLAIGVANGQLGDRTYKVFFNLASKLGFTVDEIERIAESARPRSEDQADEEQGSPGPEVPLSRERALDILRLTDPVDQKDVKRAFREMAQQYHPDKVSHLGPEFSTLAASRMRQINEAYEYLTSQ